MGDGWFLRIVSIQKAMARNFSGVELVKDLLLILGGYSLCLRDSGLPEESFDDRQLLSDFSKWLNENYPAGVGQGYSWTTNLIEICKKHNDFSIDFFYKLLDEFLESKGMCLPEPKLKRTEGNGDSEGNGEG